MIITSKMTADYPTKLVIITKDNYNININMCGKGLPKARPFI